MRTAIAILVGFVLWTVLFLGGNALLTSLMPTAFNEDGSTNSTGLLAVLLLLTVLYSVVSGYVTGRITLQQKERSGLLLGILLLIVGVGVQFQFWEILPLWYNLAFLVLLIPGAWIGASKSSHK